MFAKAKKLFSSKIGLNNVLDGFDAWQQLIWDLFLRYSYLPVNFAKQILVKEYK